MPKMASDILQNLGGSGFEVYITGGVVHDIILERPLLDWDFTTSATPTEILSVFPDAFYNNRFGTVGLADPDIPGCVYDITTFRTEVAYSDRRHPDEVCWGKTLEEDITRRDFTVNAMALKPIKKIKSRTSPKLPAEDRSNRSATTVWEMELSDTVGGQEDLKNRLIRAVGDPDERLKEDALRMMRAVRIATQLGFLIEEKTFAAIGNNTKLLGDISAERIRDELLKTMATDYPADGIKLLRNSGILDQVLPELSRCFGVEQKSPGRHHIYDVGTHLVLSLANCPSKDPLVRLATLLHDIGKPLTYRRDDQTGMITFYNHELVGTHLVREIAYRLRLSRQQRDLLVKLVRWHQFTVDEHQTDSALRRFIRNVGVENLEAMLALRTGDRLGGGARETSWRLETFKTRLAQVQQVPFQVKDLKISGYDVMQELEIPSGPLVGKILDQLFVEVDEGRLANEKEPLLARMRELGQTKQEKK